MSVMVDFVLYPKKKAIVLAPSVRLPEDFPYKEVEVGGKSLRVVKHDLTNTLALRNLQLDIPSPIRSGIGLKSRTSLNRLSIKRFLLNLRRCITDAHYCWT